MFTFDPNKIQYHDQIGSGSFGSVFPYRAREDIIDDRWVVKHLIAHDSAQFIRYIQEIVLGFNCEHPAILPMRGYYINESFRNESLKVWNMYIKLPRMVETLKDKLNSQIKKKIQFTEELLVQYLYTMASGLEYLHGRRIAHKDIKPSNVLIDKEGKLKLADIGIAEYIAEGETSISMRERGGTKLYMAPEILSKETKLKKRDLFKADIWSLGVVFAQLCLQEQPDRIADYLGNPKEILDKLEGRYNKLLVDLIEGMVCIDAKKRISAGDICRALQGKYRVLLGDRVAEMEEEKKEESGNRRESRIMKNELKKWEGVFKLEAKEILKVQPIDRSRITDKSLENYFKEAGIRLKGNNLSTAQQLSVNLSWCTEVTGIGLKEMVSQIAVNATDVQDLSLKLAGCKKVADAGIKEMMDTIYNELNNLKCLALDFTNCSDLTDKGIKGIVPQLDSGENRSLRNLSLKFSGCIQLTDDGLKTFGEQLTQKLTHLNYLQLDFSWCGKITDKGINELTSSIKSKLPNLQRLTIDLQGCEKISLKTKSSLKESLVFIRN